MKMISYHYLQAVMMTSFLVDILFLAESVSSRATPSDQLFHNLIHRKRSFPAPRSSCAFLNPCKNHQQDGLELKIFQPRHQVRSPTALGAIRGFRIWLENNFPSSMTTIKHPAVISRKTYKNSTNSKYPKFQPEVFDHVLIDGNQFLHNGVRNAMSSYTRRQGSGKDSNFDEKAIQNAPLLFTREIDRLTSTIAIPRRSLVIAVDGSPGAAKIELQRRRRFDLYRKSQKRKMQINTLKKRGWRDVDFGDIDSTTRAVNKRDFTQITPGTTFMDNVTNALVYWAWSRIINPFWHTRADDLETSEPLNRGDNDGVKIYISPSSVPGEGEIKLLDWMNFGQYNSESRDQVPTIQPGESVAILGGDSDLVLLGLALPPSVTHNVRTIFPKSKKQSLVISIWEITSVLCRMVQSTKQYHGGDNKKVRKSSKIRDLTAAEIYHLRMDLVLLLIMSGNDYLPQIRGCNRDNLFDVYLSLIRSWLNNNHRRASFHNESLPTADGERMKEVNGDKGKKLRPFLLDLDHGNRLSINVPFALAFFRELVKDDHGFLDADDGNYADSPQPQPIFLESLVLAKLLPSPYNFTVLPPEESLLVNLLANSSLNTISKPGTELDSIPASSSPTDLQQKPLQMNSVPCQSDLKTMAELLGNEVKEAESVIRITLGQFPEHHLISSSFNLENLTLEHIGDNMTATTMRNFTNECEITTTLFGERDGHWVVSRIIRREGAEGSRNAQTKSGGRSYLFELPHRQFDKIKKTEQRLNRLAATEIFGEENMDELFGDTENEVDSKRSPSFRGKIRRLSSSNVTSYLGGLIWNLETYQNGYYADYGYNYGRRYAPLPKQVVKFLEASIEQGKLRLTRADLLGESFSAPMSDGLACLAVLPPQERHFVPEPYSWLCSDSSKEDVDAIYNSCLDPETNVFNVKSFQKKCNSQLSEIAQVRQKTKTVSARDRKKESNVIQKRETQMYTGDTFWTVLSRSKPLPRSFVPPKPYTSGLPYLRRSRRIAVTKMRTTSGHNGHRHPNFNGSNSRFSKPRHKQKSSTKRKRRNRDIIFQKDGQYIHNVSFKKRNE